MMKFGLFFEEKKIVLIDMETGEILAETPFGIKKWLTAYEEYTLEIVQICAFCTNLFLCNFTIDILAEMWYNRRAAGCRQGPNPAP